MIVSDILENELHSTAKTKDIHQQQLLNIKSDASTEISLLKEEMLRLALLLDSSNQQNTLKHQSTEHLYQGLVTQLNTLELQLKNIRKGNVFFQEPFVFDSAKQYHVFDLLNYYDTAFVKAAYEVILRREPDQSGMAYYLSRLRKGCSKLGLLGQMRYSQEGREVNIEIVGLKWRLILEKICLFPIVGIVPRVLLSRVLLSDIKKRLNVQENFVIQALETIAALNNTLSTSIKLNE
ncbi:DUF4214 domain-containing protein [Legionella lytica]|uniref:DUF4214 domain-containing protein n=1 Tax=Legionella lytica TaxID=96232 RepID=A0ABW8DDJ1_9GAMM